MTKDEIRMNYEIDENGVITSPGKFEKEMYFAVSYWGDALDGFADEERYNQDGYLVAHFDLSNDDYSQFSELEGSSQLFIWEDENGFVFCTHE